MRSEALENLLTMLRANGARAEGVAMSLEDGRAGYDALGQILTPPPGATFEAMDLGGVPGAAVRTPASDPERCVVYLHGGGYCIGSLASHRAMVSHLAHHAKATVYAVDYRLAPEHAAPAALDDAVRAFRWVVANVAVPSRTVLAGDSAGGGLTLASLLVLRDGGDPLPAAGVLLSPWADLSQSGATMASKAGEDPLVRAQDLAQWSDLYRRDLPAEDPRVSPVFGDLTGLPPLLIDVGTSEVLLDDARRVAARAAAAGVEVVLTEGEDLIHVWHFFAGAVPEADDALARVGQFIQSRTPSPSDRSTSKP